MQNEYNDSIGALLNIEFAMSEGHTIPDTPTYKQALARGRLAIECHFVGERPVYRQLVGGKRLYFCKSCSREIDDIPNFCPNCGERLLWEDYTEDGEA